VRNKSALFGEMTIWKKIALLVGCIAVSFAPGAFGSRFQPGAWYGALEKPALTPPGWAFPVAWTALYAAMGIALYLYLSAPARPVPRIPLVLFAAQLALNGAWSWLFFGLQRPGLALVGIAVLWLVIAATALGFWRRRPSAGALLLPYLLWVSFAAYLNAGVWWLNRGGLG
jgi:translocator protein